MFCTFDFKYRYTKWEFKTSYDMCYIIIVKKLVNKAFVIVFTQFYIVWKTVR
jgi:hypothetical protein